MPKSIALTIASSKGGQMKSILAANLAVRAMKDGKVALIDWEPQGSLTNWWKLRKRPDNPHLHVTYGDLAADVAKLKSEGYRTIILDTPPAPMEPILRAVLAADLTLIPTRVSVFDLAGIRPVIGFAEGRKSLFVLVGTNPEEPGWPALIKGATKALKRHGKLATKTIRERAVYISSLNTGKAAGEVAGGKAAGDEINALWQAIKRAAQ